MKKSFLILMMLLVSILLSSCSLPTASILDLMQPPKLSDEQRAVNDALRRALGTDSYTLKYPRSGNYRSAYVFYDIDDDDEEEAIVFYRLDVDNSGTRINILDLMDGEWFSVYDVPGVGQGDVDYITFENIESPDYKNIIIGWQPESSAENEMAIYTYDNFKLDIRYKERYSQSIIRDLNGDGLMDVALISLNEHTIRLVTAQDGDIRSAHELSISKSIRSISQLTFGRLPSGEQALFLDLALDRSNYATEILTVENNRLVPQINVSGVYDYEFLDEDVDDIPTEQEIENFMATQRQEEILSADINSDGIMEVPSSVPMPGYEDVGEEGQIFYRTVYSVLMEGKMTPVLNACVNVEAGYMILLPERWIGTVTVVADGSASQWQFIKYTGNLNDRSVELLRVGWASVNDFPDRFENRIELAQKGIYQYYGYIPPTEEKELRIDQEELLEMFVLL